MICQFFGAVHTVTGSKTVVSDDGKKILIDCGLFQGKKELRTSNWVPPAFNPSELDAVILTHAHLDHSGYLPLLARNGFKGTIYCTEPTAKLAELILMDSAKIQEDDANRANRYGYSKHSPALPLYTQQDVEAMLPQFEVKSFGQPFTIHDYFTVTLSRSGHILGASFITLANPYQNIVFSGDIGRVNDPVMLSPAILQNADNLVLESTYGNRLHEHVDPQEQIEYWVNKTIARNGTLVIPAFAVGRAQVMLYHLYKLQTENRIPNVPIYLDSPMSVKATELFCHYTAEHRLSPDLAKAVMDMATIIETIDQSKAISDSSQPCIILSASGMATGGRVLHHIAHTIADPKNTILFTGFQAAGTRGERIVNGEKDIKIHGQYYPVNADIVSLDNMSAHADYDEILSWLSHFNRPPKNVFLNHGEDDAIQGLKQRLEDQLGWNVTVPNIGQPYRL